MKVSLKAKILSSALVPFFFLSCSPKDELVQGTRLADRLQGQGNGGDSGPKVFMSDEEVYKLTAVSLDRATESLMLMRAVLDPEYSKKHKLGLVQLSPESAEVLETVMTLKPKVEVDANLSEDEQTRITSDNLKKDTITVENPEQTFRYTLGMNYVVNQSLEATSNKLNFMTFNKNDSRKFDSKGEIKSGSSYMDYKSIPLEEIISISKADESQNIYLVEIRKKEKISSRRDKESTIESKIKMYFKWDGLTESLKNPIQIVGLNLDIFREGAKHGSFKTSDLKADMNVTLKDDCVTVNGSTNLLVKFKGKAPVQFVFEDSTISVPEINFTSKAKDCAYRPAVDLTRLF